MHWIAKGAVGLTKVALGIDPAQSRAVAQRDVLCNACPQLRHTLGLRRCGVCGCILAAKVRLASQKCSDKPPRWDAISREG
jgi:hypothetical protein